MQVTPNSYPGAPRRTMPPQSHPLMAEVVETPPLAKPRTLNSENPGRSELFDVMLDNQIMINERVRDYLTNAEQLTLTPKELNDLAGAAGLKAGQSGLNYFA